MYAPQTKLENFQNVLLLIVILHFRYDKHLEHLH